MSRLVLGVGATVLALSTAACSGSTNTVIPLGHGTSTSSRTPSSTSPAPSASSTTSAQPAIDSAAKPAVEAYLKFWAAARQAEDHPLPFGRRYPTKADFTNYSFTPLRLKLQTDLSNLASDNIRYGGDPGRPRVKVKTAHLNAKPLPTVTLLDCPTRPHRRFFNTRTGKDVTTPSPKGTVAPPYLVTVTMIYTSKAGSWGKHWGVATTHPDSSRTCTP